MLCSNSGKWNSDSGHVECSRKAQVLHNARAVARSLVVSFVCLPRSAFTHCARVFEPGRLHERLLHPGHDGTQMGTRTARKPRRLIAGAWNHVLFSACLLLLVVVRCHVYSTKWRRVTETLRDFLTVLEAADRWQPAVHQSNGSFRWKKGETRFKEKSYCIMQTAKNPLLRFTAEINQALKLTAVLQSVKLLLSWLIMVCWRWYRAVFLRSTAARRKRQLLLHSVLCWCSQSPSYTEAYRG